MLSTTGLEHLQGALLLIGGLYFATLVGLVRLSGIKFGLSIGALELLAVGVDAIRIYLCFSVLGFNVEIFQTAVLTISAVLGSAVSIVVP